MSKQGVINIHGKEYQTVALRVSQFRQLRPDWTIACGVVENTENRVVVKCDIADEKGRLIATGHAEEFRAASKINRTSALENAETSAVGRALAFLGLGGEQIASADEVLNAVSQQEADEVGKDDGVDYSADEYDSLKHMLEDAPEVFEKMFMTQSDERKSEIANLAVHGEKTEWKNALRNLEKSFHERMDIMQDSVTDCHLNNAASVLLEWLEEVEEWEKPYLWARLSETEKAYIREIRQ
jgi:hypothetical protein